VSQILLAFPAYTVEARSPGGHWEPVGAVGGNVQAMTLPEAVAWLHRLRERVRRDEATPRRASEPVGWRGVELRVDLVRRAE
jgi:hypothetical protein